MTLNNPKGTVQTTIDKRIATLEFGHPASNSFPSELLDRLTNEFYKLSENPEVFVIVLKSPGDVAFCAGASFNELIDISNAEEGKQFFAGFANLMNAMRKCSKLIIGRIQGKAVGGGVGIAAACDYAMATEKSSIRLTELSIGIGPFVVEPAITRKIGKGAMMTLALETHEWKTAAWAHTKGLYSKVFATTEDLDREIALFATMLTSFNQEALITLKKVFWEGTEDWDTILLDRAKISGTLVLSDSTKKILGQIKK